MSKMKALMRKICRHTVLVISLALLLSNIRAPVYAVDETPSGDNKYNVAIVTDASGSMGYSDPHKYRFEAIKLFSNLLSDHGNTLGGIVFSTGIDQKVDLRKINSQADKDEVVQTLSTAKSDGNWTNIGLALSEAVDMLTTNGDPSLPSVIVFLSDGNTDMSTDKLKEESLQIKSEAIQRARENGIKIFTVCLNADSSADTTEMEQIAVATGGTFREVTKAEDLNEVFNTFYGLIYGTSTISLGDNVFPADGVIDTEFDVPGFGVEEVNIIIYGNIKDIGLKKPDGSDYPLSARQADTFTMIKITDASPGTWVLHTTGTSGDHIKINMVYNTTLRIELSMEKDSKEYLNTDKVKFFVKLISNGTLATKDEDYVGYDAALRIHNGYGEELDAMAMTVSKGSFVAERTFDEGVYYFSATVLGNGFSRESEKIGPVRVTVPSAPPEPVNTAPTPVEEVVERKINIWPFQKPTLEIDMSTLATDAEDSTLRYDILSSAFLEGKDYTRQGDIITINNFSLRKGAFSIKATDSGGLSCLVEVIVISYNIGLMAAIGFGVLCLIGLIAAIFIIHKLTSARFMGSISVRSSSTAFEETQTPTRGSYKLKYFSSAPPGFHPKTRFQASGKKYITLVSPVLMYDDTGLASKKIRIDHNFPKEIKPVDPNIEPFSEGIRVTFISNIP